MLANRIKKLPQVLRPALAIIRRKNITRKFLKNVTGRKNQFGSCHMRALLYYKTAPLINRELVDRYIHSNNWQILEIARQLHDVGFVVDVVDRSCRPFDLEDNYDIFIGLAGCGSGRFFGDYAVKVKKAIKIAFLTTSHPMVLDERNALRYEWFKENTGFYSKRMRADRSETEKLTNDLSEADYFFLVGEKNTFAYRSYDVLRKKIYPLYNTTMHDLKFKSCWTEERDRKKFVCFAGNGFIHKGVDLLVEAFLKMPDLSLTICGPSPEDAFSDCYKDIIEESFNIHYAGFVGVGGAEFYDIASSHSFVILYSSSESSCTSIATMMRVGVVPVINYETSVDVRECGIIIDSHQKDREGAIKNIVNSAEMASNLANEEYKKLVHKTLVRSQDFTQASFSSNLKLSLLDVLSKCQVPYDCAPAE